MLQWPEDKDRAEEEDCSHRVDMTLKDARASSEGTGDTGDTAPGGSSRRKALGRADHAVVQADHGAVQFKCRLCEGKRLGQSLPW